MTSLDTLMSRTLALSFHERQNMDVSQRMLFRKIAFGERLAQARMRLKLSQEELAEIIGTTARSVSRWERSKAVPQQHYWEPLAEALLTSPEKLFGEDEQQCLNNYPAQIWHIPYTRNSYFTGREKILNQLYTKLHAPTHTISTHPPILSGLAGIGKTEIALEYVYRFGKDYQTILWIRSNSREAFLSDYMALADLLQLPSKKHTSQFSKEQAVKRWLETHTNWLLILDGMEDLKLLNRLLPRSNQGYVLITTRSQITGPLGCPIDVPTMDLAEGTSFLLRRAGFQLSDMPPAEISVLRTQAENLCALVDGLPLALDQAGAYIEESICGLAGYLERYAVRQSDLLANRGAAASHHHPDSVSRTFSFCFRQVEKASPLAADLLRLCAFLPCASIPESLLTRYGKFLGPALQALASDPLLLDKLITQLRHFSLLRREATTRTLHIHRLLQIIIQNEVGAEERQQWTEHAQKLWDCVNAQKLLEVCNKE